MRLPSGFLDNAVLDAAHAYQLRDASDQVVEADPLFALCCTWAYNLIVQECKHEFHKEQRTEVYNQIDKPFTLRHIPVDLTQPITVWIDEEQLSATDFTVQFGRLVVPGLVVPEVAPSCYDHEMEFIVQYTGGYARCEEDSRLLTALSLQTIANYNRRDKFGLTTVTSTQGMTQVPDSTVGLIAAVKEIVSPMIYDGRGSYLIP